MKKSSTLSQIDQKSQQIEKESESIYDFEVLLDKTKGLDDKKKILWKQIYTNAVNDRASAGSHRASPQGRR